MRIEDHEKRWKDFNERFRTLREHGRIEEATAWAEEALKAVERECKPHDPTIAHWLVKVALCYQSDQTRWAEAEAMLRRALVMAC